MTDWNNDSIRRLERDSIEVFVRSCAPLLTGRVLDYGCGDEPYKGIVENAGGIYSSYDPARDDGGWATIIGAHRWDAILCTQVLQFVPDVPGLLGRFAHGIALDGVLVMSIATNWDEVETTDLHRFTQAGIRRLITNAGLVVMKLERRAEINLGGFRFPARLRVRRLRMTVMLTFAATMALGFVAMHRQTLWYGHRFTRPIFRLLRLRRTMLNGFLIRMTQGVLAGLLLPHRATVAVIVILYLDDCLSGDNDGRRFRGWARNKVKWLMELPAPPEPGTA